MHVIIPAGGRGTRMRPLSHGSPKALAPLADGTLLDHALAGLRGTGARRVTVVSGPEAGPFVEALAERSEPQIRVVAQPEPLGQADAILRAIEPGAGPVLILFVDTLHDIDLRGLAAACGDADGLIHVKAVPDPSAFGVAVIDPEGFAERLVEKPREPVQAEAVIGVYYLRDSARLEAAIRRLIARGARGQTRGEFYLLDALQHLIDDGARLRARPAGLWLDCGSPEALLRANRHVLGRLRHEVDPAALGPGARIVPPVRIAPGARVARAVVGPRVAIAPGARIEDSIVGAGVGVGRGARVFGARIADTLIGAESQIRDAVLDGSVLGRGAHVRATALRAVIGRDSRVGPR